MAFWSRFKRKTDKRPSIRRKAVLSLGAIASVLVLSGIISILEYRRMSDYVSELISANIKSITLSQELSDIMEEYNHQMLAVVIQNDISMMPDFNKDDFKSHSDALRNSITAEATLPMVEAVEQSFYEFIRISMKFDEVFLADNVDTGEWFFGTLQPAFYMFTHDMNSLNTAIHEELQNNSADFDAGFYRSIIPGMVSVCAGLIMIFLLMYFIISNYVNPIYRISDGLDLYRSKGRRYANPMAGDDHLANINEAVEEIIDENMELKKRIKNLKDEK